MNLRLFIHFMKICSKENISPTWEDLKAYNNFTRVSKLYFKGGFRHHSNSLISQPLLPK
jgi:hypothetical protein